MRGAVEGVEDAVADAAESDFSEIVGPAFFFIGDVISLWRMGGATATLPLGEGEGVGVVGLVDTEGFGGVGRGAGEQVRIVDVSEGGLGDGEFDTHFAFGFETGPV